MFIVYPKNQMEKVLAGTTMLRPVPMNQTEAIAVAEQMTGRERGLIIKLMKPLPRKANRRTFLAAQRGGTAVIIQYIPVS